VDALRARFELDDPVRRSVEQRAIVRDEHDAALDPQQEALEQLEPGEVEIVRRLVQQEDVEPREQDRGERGSAPLAAGELARRPVERGIEPDLGQDASGARAAKSAPPRARKWSSASACALVTDGLRSRAASSRASSASASAMPVRRARYERSVSLAARSRSCGR